MSRAFAYDSRPEIARAASTTARSARSAPSAGKRYAGPCTWIAATALPRASRTGAATDEIPSANSSMPQAYPARRTSPSRFRRRRRIRDRATRQRHELAGEVGVERVLRPLGEQDETRRHGVHRRARSRPVAHLHRVVGLDSVHVQDLGAVRQAEARVLVQLGDEIGKDRTRSRDQPALAGDPRGECLHPGADAPARPLEALDGLDLLERGEQARHRRLRERDALGDGSDAGRAPRHLVEDGERALERLHHRPEAPRIPLYSTVPRYGTR